MFWPYGESSGLVCEGEVHIWIEKPEMCSIPGGSIRFDQPKPEIFARLDQNLWEKFRADLNLEVMRLNYGKRALFFLQLALFSLLLSAPYVNYVYKFRLDIALRIALLVFVFGSTLCHVFIIKTNQAVDTVIFQICQDYDVAFRRAVGYGVEYRTRHAGFCKPKGARPKRVIIFPLVGRDAPNVLVGAESKTSLLNGSTPDEHDDLIDREAWGLSLS